ncbi:DUF1648 domain-containing protein [Oceanobacillus chungangensis]|uniref:DUF1648 domain-containing protein n=1 Tax=Oceanobacillus chungangensis TaxID=1229152 RepID=A0A3D8PJ70_9BACI|nr:DUF1648 domain-containing protein [Oceanobacillus chungangensis]RDW15527.1 hypothetical protein CWR45_17270 [Oceanobacillus chungangensis]
MANASNRPKLKIQKTKSEFIWDIIGLSCHIGSIILLIVVWNSLPVQVPAHYNALGEVDRWGVKWELLILPIIGALIIILMQVFERYPETHNYPERLNSINAQQFYLNSRKMVNQLKNISQIILASIIFESISIALAWGKPLGGWFLPAALFSVFIPIIIGIVKQRKIQ